MTVAADATSLPRRHAALEQAGLLALFGVAGALQFSIAIAQNLLTVSILCWPSPLALSRYYIEVPSFSYTLRVHAGLDGVLTRPAPQPDGVQADGAVSAGAARL